METLVDAPKQEERKFNLRLTGFEAKECETKKELVKQLNTKLLQGQMKLRTKVITATWQRPTVVWAFALTVGARLDIMMPKFVMNKDYKAQRPSRNQISYCGL